MKKIGLTGCGSIGRLHAENLKGCAEILFHNRTRGRAEAFARKFGGLVCESFEELIESADGVVIATPPSQHEIEVSAALTAGVSVLVEKPDVRHIRPGTPFSRFDITTIRFSLRKLRARSTNNY